MPSENIIRSKLEGDETVLGARIRSISTTLLQVLGQAKVDYGYIDLEHAGFSPYDSQKLEHLQMAAEKAGIGLIVRIPDSKPAMIRKVLDAGIRTIVVPRVESVQEVEAVVRASRYSYNGQPGKRGLGTAPVNDWGVRPKGFTEQEDEKTLVGVMVETESAVENIQQITSVPELGFVKIGASDLSVSLGYSQDYENEVVLDTINEIEQTCYNNKIPIGRGVSSLQEAKKAIGNGYRLVEVGGDVGALRSTIESRVEEIVNSDRRLKE